MAKLIQNIGSESIQKHTILFGDYEIILLLRFYSRNKMWLMDVNYRTTAFYGVKLSVGVLHMLSKNLPFDFIVSDLSGNGIDPFKSTDFSNGRCQLYLLEADDMQDIRNVEVQE